ncbi:uncharacterized protein LOC127797882 [Diospyros lotus]|uniref:uncharacterized protein LOC127797882 n=1 Tax=Diospyros lotus TaxID=55363 RepID=UPI00225B7686|nr:uncharacterized protein LOC127797882 [Diospyros lotus]
MDSKIEATVRREYEDFEPKTEVITGDDKETLVIYLPGFKKSQLRLQLTPNRLFMVSGERQVAINKWSRVAKEYPASANGDMSRVTAKFEKEALSIIQPKLIAAKVADKEKPAGAESTSPARPKSAEKPANVEAQAQPKQKEEGSNNNGRVRPSEDHPLKQKEESKMAPAPSKQYCSSSSVAAGQPAANAKTSELAKKETDEKMKGTVAEDDGAVVGKARKTSDDQKHRNGNGNGNGDSLARNRIGGWTETLKAMMIGSKPRMVVSIVLVVVVALLLGLYITSSPMPANNNNIKHD